MLSPDNALRVEERNGETGLRETTEARRAGIVARMNNVWRDFYDGRKDQGQRIQTMDALFNGLSKEDQAWLEQPITLKNGKVVTRAMQIAARAIDEARLEAYPSGAPPSVAKATRKEKSKIRSSGGKRKKR
jgi:hypothetical protein